MSPVDIPVALLVYGTVCGDAKKEVICCLYRHHDLARPSSSYTLVTVRPTKNHLFAGMFCEQLVL